MLISILLVGKLCTRRQDGYRPQFGKTTAEILQDYAGPVYAMLLGLCPNEIQGVDYNIDKVISSFASLE